MANLLTAAQMQALETVAIKSGSVTGLELMERAGQGVVDAIFEAWPKFLIGGHYATVLCGPGNNGGDGYVIARLLVARGWFVEVYYYGNPERLPPDARHNYLAASKVVQVLAPMEPGLGDGLFETDTKLIIDAVFGIGLTRPLDDLAGDVLANEIALFVEQDLATKCVAVDIPSGICTEDGTVLERPPFKEAFKAHLTVTFHQKKWGHVTGDGPQYCGKVVVKDIGL